MCIRKPAGAAVAALLLARLVAQPQILQERLIPRRHALLVALPELHRFLGIRIVFMPVDPPKLRTGHIAVFAVAAGRRLRRFGLEILLRHHAFHVQLVEDEMQVLPLGDQPVERALRFSAKGLIRSLAADLSRGTEVEPAAVAG